MCYIWHPQFTHAATVIALMNLKSFIPVLNQLVGQEDVYVSANYIMEVTVRPQAQENSPQ